MPIALDTRPVPDPHDVTLPGKVTISQVLHSSGNDDTFATIEYTITAGNNVFFSGMAKALRTGPFAVRVPPGTVNDDILSLVKGAGPVVSGVTIGLEIQETNAAGAPIGPAQHANATIGIS